MMFQRVHKAARKRMNVHYREHGAVRLSRAVLLLHIQCVLIVVLALIVGVVLFYTGKDKQSFYLTLVLALLFMTVTAAVFNFIGRFSLALAMTGLILYAGPWASAIFERTVHSGDLIPIIYIIVPTPVCALLLSGRTMTLLGALQCVAFGALVLTDPAHAFYNWPSLICFVFLMTVLGATTSHVARLQYDESILVQEKLAKSEARLTDLSRHDELTGLFNRRHMEDALAALVGRQNQCFGVAMLDIDNYKAINDMHGHACGDALIREIAKVIAGVLLPAEAAFRYGGDEFLITLACTDCTALRARGEALRSAIEKTRFQCPEADEIAITASVGVSLFPACGRDRDAVLRAADRALYTAKHSGKNRVVTCEMLCDAPIVAEI